MAAALRETEITAEEARELGQIMADEAARAPRGPRVRFVNMVEIRQRVTLPGLPMLNPLTGSRRPTGAASRATGSRSSSRTGSARTSTATRR
jgi:hypothetical protein